VAEWLRTVAARKVASTWAVTASPTCRLPDLSVPWWPNTSALIFWVSATSNSPVSQKHRTRVAHLAAALGIKRCARQHHDAVLARSQRLDRRASGVERQHRGGLRQVLVAHKGVARAGVFQCTVHLEFARCAALGLLRLHGGIEAGFVHFNAVFAAYIGREV